MTKPDPKEEPKQPQTGTTPPAAEAPPEDRFKRQKDIVPAEKLAMTRICVIGCGAVGRQVALQLASIGARQIQLCDFDRIELTNVTTQGYRQIDIGDAKVAACERSMKEIDPEIEIELIDDRFRPHLIDATAIFCCVDDIEVRKTIWENMKDRVQFFCDARMLGEQMHVITMSGEHGKDYYPATLFPKEEAQTGRCTAQSTVYTAMIAAGLMIHQFTRWLRDIKPDLHVTLDLLASDLTVIDAAKEAEEVANLTAMAAAAAPANAEASTDEAPATT